MKRKELIQEMRRLKSSGRHEDKKAAQVVLAQIGRNAKQLKRESESAQTSLFDTYGGRPLIIDPYTDGE